MGDASAPPRSDGATGDRAQQGTAARVSRPFRLSDSAPRHPEPLPGSTPPPPPPPPAASARFPDAPPGESWTDPATRPAAGPEETRTETTARLRPLRPEPPVESLGAGRPFVSFAEPYTEPHDSETVDPRPTRNRARVAAAAACIVLGLGLIGGAATGSWLTGDGTDEPGSRGAFAAAGELWHSVPVDQLFPPTVQGDGAGPGGADRTWTRIAVAPDSGCQDAFDPLLRKALAPVGCLRLLRATYTDATRSHVTTVGLLFTKADAAAMTSLKTRFKAEGLDRRTDLMPRPYAAKGTVAADFGDTQRGSWTVSVLTDAPVVVYAVSGFADGRAVTAPQPAADAMQSGATTAPAQAGLGQEAQGLADRVERGFRKTIVSATEKPS
ncbi:hypothetical protein [Streptomyces sp. SAS_270]|uniref:hypothetical protein n=1 Tax=Streptomyces sp. SAS_270 TaxID=3412748 RepID=UPI00403C94BF